MNKPEKDILNCSHCGNELKESDKFCPNCGNLFEENIVCGKHHQNQAEGMCLICQQPFCTKCGSWINDLFLCATHEDYEIYEGMTRVFGTSDAALAQHAQNCLEESGMETFLYERKTSPLSMGGPEYSLFRASGEYDGHIINEVKLMVPCKDVLQAEQILTELEILE